MKKNKVPEIRFSGFTDDWELRKAKELCKISTGKGNTQDKVENGNYPFYVRSATIERSNDFLYNQEAVLTVGDGVGTGKVFHYVNGKYNLHQRVYRMYDFNEDVSSKYYYYYFSINFYRRVMAMTAKTSVDSVRMEMIADMGIRFPSKNEQIKIVLFFDNLNHTIALHQRELEILKNTKKAFLQKMFPKKGEKVPEVRFPGFTDDWELRKLGEIVQITMGQSPNSENYTENPSDHILVQGNADMKNNRVVPRVWTTQVTKQADKGDLILSVRAPVGDVGKTDYAVVLGRGVASIKGNEFLFQTLGRMKENGFWTKLSTGSTFESINSSDIKDASISLPNEDEQIQIGTFFKQLDNTIALHQRELTILQNTKKAFLQKMFV